MDNFDNLDNEDESYFNFLTKLGTKKKLEKRMIICSTKT